MVPCEDLRSVRPWAAMQRLEEKYPHLEFVYPDDGGYGLSLALSGGKLLGVPASVLLRGPRLEFAKLGKLHAVDYAFLEGYTRALAGPAARISGSSVADALGSSSAIALETEETELSDTLLVRSGR